MESCWDDAAGELQLWIARAMGVDATIKDWILWENKCSAWSMPFATLFAEWLSKREAGITFGEFAGGKEQIGFVKRHMEGKQCMRARFSEHC
jgi:hypothetical protein